MNFLKEILLNFEFHYNSSEILKIKKFWNKYTDFKTLCSKNYLTSKYCLAIGEVVDNNPHNKIIQKKFKQVLAKIKKENNIYIDDGEAFELFCYSLLKKKTNISFHKENIKTKNFDFKISSSFIEVKSNKLQSINSYNNEIEKTIDNLINKSSINGTLYFDINLENDKNERLLLEAINSKITTLLAEIELKSKIIRTSFIAESCIKSLDNLCLIRINYFPEKIVYKDFWIGTDLAGNFTEAHTNINYYVSINYLRLNYGIGMKQWVADKKNINTKQPFFVAFTTFPSAINDNLEILRGFIETKKAYPMLKGVYFIDIWESNQNLATISVFTKDKKDSDMIVKEFDSTKVKFNFYSESNY